MGLAYIAKLWKVQSAHFNGQNVCVCNLRLCESHNPKKYNIISWAYVASSVCIHTPTAGDQGAGNEAGHQQLQSGRVPAPRHRIYATIVLLMSK